MWYLTLHRWVGDQQRAIEQALPAHLAWMREQQLAGRVLIADPASTDNWASSSSARCPARPSTTCSATNR